MRKSYKFKAKVSKTTAAFAEQWLSRCCELYNLCLEQRITAYKRCGISLSSYTQNKDLPEFKKQFPEFKKINSQCLQNVTDRLNKAFIGFFSRIKKNVKAGFPRFKSFKRYNSFTLTQSGWQLSGRHLKIKGVGIFKLYISREIQGVIKTVTIRRDSCGDWFVIFSCDSVPVKNSETKNDVIGLDVGLLSFVTDSDGGKFSSPKFLQRSLRNLRKKQRTLSRRAKSSKRREKAKKIVAKHHRKISNQRNDFLFKTAKHYTDKYRLIFVERLNVSNMCKNKYLSKSILDSSWGKFIEILDYKAEEAGGQLVRVNPHNTSQNCSSCGVKVEKDLSVRLHECPSCGLIMDRDMNAAVNILNRGSGQLLQALT